MVSSSPSLGATSKPRASFHTLPRELRQLILLRTFTEHHPAEFIAKVKNRYDKLYAPYFYQHPYCKSEYRARVQGYRSSGEIDAGIWAAVLNGAATFSDDDVKYVEAVWMAGFETAAVEAEEVYEELKKLKISNPAEFLRIVGHNG